MAKVKEVKWSRVAEKLEENTFFEKYKELEIKKQFSFQTDEVLLFRFSILKEGEVLVFNEESTFEIKINTNEITILEDEVVTQVLVVLKKLYA